MAHLEAKSPNVPFFVLLCCQMGFLYDDCPVPLSPKPVIKTVFRAHTQEYVVTFQSLFLCLLLRTCTSGTIHHKRTPPVT